MIKTNIRLPQRHPVVVITGAGAGLGRAITQAFARQGARMCLVSRGTERLEEARREAIHLGGHAISPLPAMSLIPRC